MPPKTIISIDIINKMACMYLDEKKSMKEIAHCFPYSVSTIRKAFIENNILIRSLSEAITIASSNRKPLSPEAKMIRSARASNAMKIRWESPSFLNKMKATHNWWTEDDITKLKSLYLEDKLSLSGIAKLLNRSCNAIKARLQYLGIQRTKSEAMKIYNKREHPWEDIERRGKVIKCLISAARKRWGNLEFVRKMALIWQMKPSTTEIIIGTLLQEVFPDLWRYVGDGNYVIGNKIPDFIDEAARKIIEVNGCYWHACEICGYGDVILPNGQTAEEVRNRDKNKLGIYKDHGWNSLVVWEHELNDIDKLSNVLMDYTLRTF